MIGPLRCLLLGALVLFAVDADALERGDLGHGVTVLQGEEPERFEVEILGVMESWGSAGNTILARLSGANLEKTGVLQGMSGSPVFVDGELIGAVASTWGFASEPIAGIRPIAEMRQLARDLESGVVDGLELVAAPDVTEGGLVWAASGFAPGLQGAMADALGAPVVQAAAVRGDATTPRGDGSLEGGDAVAVMLVDGDARLFATGTVTERIGDTVLAFGHPFLGAGPVSLPMARAEVVAVMPSREISFKMAVPTEVVGALELDRRAGVAGRLGVTADTVPMRLTVTGAAAGVPQTYDFRLARMRMLTPQLLGWAVQSAINDRRELATDYRVDVATTVRFDGEPPLTTEASFLGAAASAGLGSEVALPVQLVAFARDDTPRLESIEIDVRIEPGATGSLVGRIQVDDPRLVPGAVLDVRIELLERDGSARWERMRVDVPANLQPGPYRLHVNDGVRAFGEEIARSPGRWSDLGMRQIREAFALRRPADEIVGVLYGPSTSVVVRGIERENLPGIHRAALGRGYVTRGETSSLVTPLARTTIEAGTVVQGGGVLDLVVEPTPMASSEAPSSDQRNGKDARRDASRER